MYSMWQIYHVQTSYKVQLSSRVTFSENCPARVRFPYLVVYASASHLYVPACDVRIAVKFRSCIAPLRTDIVVPRMMRFVLLAITIPVYTNEKTLINIPARQLRSLCMYMHLSSATYFQHCKYQQWDMTFYELILENSQMNKVSWKPTGKWKWF